MLPISNRRVCCCVAASQPGDKLSLSRAHCLLFAWLDTNSRTSGDLLMKLNHGTSRSVLLEEEDTKVNIKKIGDHSDLLSPVTRLGVSWPLLAGLVMKGGCK